MTTIIVKDDLREAVEAASGGHQTVLRNRHGHPGYYFVLPKFSYEDLGMEDELGTGVCTAFLVGGVEKSELFIGAYPSVVKDGCALPLPGLAPTVRLDYDQARASCEANGAGFHMITVHEWAAVVLWCKANGIEPRGNTNCGRAHDATFEVGRREDGKAPGDKTGEARTLNGSGPAAWRHDNGPFGIADLVGNVWKWLWGMKIVKGQIFCMSDNDYTATEDNWQAHSIFFDSPADGDGSGSDILGAPSLAASVTHSGNPADTDTNEHLDYGCTTWKNMTVANGLNAESLLLLKRLAVVPTAKTDLQGNIYVRNYGERMPLRGEYWGDSGSAGLGALNLIHRRSSRSGGIGSFPAFAL